MITRNLFLFSVFVSVALASRYWDQWAAGNGGVHSNPVFKTKPQIRWTFNYNYTYNDGVVPIDNQEHAIYMANGEAGKTAYWKLSWSGHILSSWKTPWNTIFDGTMGARNGVVYIYSGSRRTLYAVNETTTELLWNKTDLVTSMNPYSNSPLEWNEDSSILYISTANQIHAITASTGDIIWSTQPTASQTAVAPLIRSTLDNTFVVNYYNNTVAKYKVSTGELVWTTSLVGSEWKTPSPPTVDNSDGSIYVTTFIDGVYKLNINGQIVWQKNDFIGWFHYFSPILFNTDYVLIVGCTTGMKLYKKSNGDSVDVFGYDYVDQQNNVRNQVFTQPLFNREQNVLYFVYSDNGTLVALDTSNINGFTVMWSLDTLLIKHSGNGPSIASDGTIFLATAWRDWPIGLVSIGCPITKQLSSDGLTCVCAPAFVASGDSCVCSDNTKEPSEDGLSCVDRPIVPSVDSPSSPVLPPGTTSSPASSNTPSRTNTPGNTNAPNSSITSDAATIGFGLMMVVLLIVDLML